MIEKERRSYPGTAQSFGITAIVIGGQLIFSPLNVLLGPVIGTEAAMLVYYVVAVGLSLWAIQKIRKNNTGDGSFHYQIENPGLIPLVILVSVALLIGVISPVSSLIPMSQTIREMLMDFGSMKGVMAFLTMVVAAPVLEEFIFRGIMLDGLLKRYSPMKAILISSFLFGVVHLNPWQFVTAFVIGLFIGWIYLHTRSLSLAVIIHAAVNLTGFVMRFFIDMETSAQQSLVDSYGGMPYLVAAIGGSVMVVLVSIYFLKRRLVKQPPQ